LTKTKTEEKKENSITNLQIYLDWVLITYER